MCDLAGYYAKWNLFWPIPNGIYQCMCAACRAGIEPHTSPSSAPHTLVPCFATCHALLLTGALTLSLTLTLTLILPLTLIRRFYFQAQGMPRPAMWNNLAFVLVNAALNWTLVFGGPFQYAPIGWHGFGFVGAEPSP